MDGLRHYTFKLYPNAGQLEALDRHRRMPHGTRGCATSDAGTLPLRGQRGEGALDNKAPPRTILNEAKENKTGRTHR